jgi:ferredoxin-type protein NapG
VAAIRILPHKLVQGKIGEHYRLGWTFDTEVTQDFKPEPQADPSSTPEPGGKAGGLDYLNSGGGL